MKLLFATAAVAAIAASAGAAQAQVSQPELYGSLGYNQKEDSDLSAVQLRLGGRFGAYLGVEGEFGLGVESDTLTIPLNTSSIQVKTQLRHEAAAYLVGYYPVTPNFDVFARVGYGTTALKRTFALDSNVTSATRSVESVNYGVGGQYFLDGKNGVRVDYTRQDYNSGLRTEDTWSVGYTRRF